MEFIYIKIIILSYLIGSIPTSFLLVKFLSGKNIAQEGSCNIGAMNSFEVTGNRFVGVLAFILDAAKGTISVLLVLTLYSFSILPASIALIFTIIGHNWSIFLKFKGGRGLSTAVGGFALINPLTIIIWLLMFAVSRIVVSFNVHINNCVASLLTILLIEKVPNYAIWHLRLAANFTVEIYQFLTFIVCSIIIISHYKPIIELFRKQFTFEDYFKL